MSMSVRIIDCKVGYFPPSDRQRLQTLQAQAAWLDEIIERAEHQTIRLEAERDQVRAAAAQLRQVIEG